MQLIQRVYSLQWMQRVTKDEALKWMIDNKKLESQQIAMTYEQGFAHGYEAHRVEQALEQPAQEPVAIVYSMQDGYVGQMVIKDIPHKTKLYTS